MSDENRAAPTVMTGRRKIYTDAPAITEENVIDVIRKAMEDHLVNASDEMKLIEYELGVQPLKRKKTYRPEIDVECVDNVASEIINFKESLVWGNPITLVQRGSKDSGTDTEVEGIALLNEQYDAAGDRMIQQEIGHYVEICGVCPAYIDVNMDYADEGDAYFTKVALHPTSAFVVYSSYYVDERPMLGVTYRTDEQGSQYYTAFTRDTRYEIVNLQEIVNGEKVSAWAHATRSGEENPLGMIPIIEYVRAIDRTGGFERQISECDNLNLMVSDFSNSVEENVQAVFLGIDIEFPKDPTTGEVSKPKNGDWFLTYSSENGKPQVQPITIDFNYPGMLQNIATRRAMILQKCNVPQRNDNSGGSTGIAMSDATGWSAAERDATREQLLIDTVKMQEVRLVLKAIKLSPDAKKNKGMAKLLKLRSVDVEPKVAREKSYELTVKANAFATLVSHGVHGKHALDLINAFPDTNQVWADSRDLIEKYQDSIFEPKQSSSSEATGGFGEKASNSDRTMSDYSDQRDNSKMIDKEA